MIISCNTIVDRRDHVQYLTVSKSYSDNCTCSLTEQNSTFNSQVHNLQKLKNTSLKAVNHFCNKNKSNLFE